MEILTIGQKIRNKRKQLNMTLKELAGDKVTAGQLSFVELGKSNPSAELLQYIAQRLGVTVDYLLESEESQARRICEYNIKLAQAYIFDGKDDTAETLLEDTVKIANKYNLGDYMGKVELNRGKIALKKMQYQKAMELFLGANKLFLQNDDFEGALETYMLLGNIAYKNGFCSLSLSYFKEAEALCRDRKLCEEQLKAKIYYGMCMCYIKMGDVEGSSKYLPLVEKYLENMSDIKLYAHNIMNMSSAYKDSGDYEKALYYANKALDIYKKIEDQEHLAKIQMYMGMIYSEKSDIIKSNFYLENCEKFQDVLSQDDKCCVLLKLAYNCIAEGKYSQALVNVEKCFKLAVECKNINYQIECYDCLYKLYMTNNNYHECESILKNKLRLVETLDDPKRLAECYAEMGEYYNLTGNKELAVNYINRGFKIFQNLNKSI